MTIDSFTGDYLFLSNFYCPTTVLYDFEVYPSSEHAYQAAKSTDPEVRNRIRGCLTCYETKKIGRKIKLRPNWDAMRLEVMEKILRSKFSKFGHLWVPLLQTYPSILIEGNTWGDRFWGAEKECGEWVGENNLGKLLMKLRDELVNQEKHTNLQ